MELSPSVWKTGLDMYGLSQHSESASGISTSRHSIGIVACFMRLVRAMDSRLVLFICEHASTHQYAVLYTILNAQGTALRISKADNGRF